MALTKADMVEHLFNEIGLNKKEAKDIVELFFNEIKQTLATGEQVKLSGFGKFELRDKVGRPGRNPKTRESISIAPRRVVLFKARSNLKGKLEGYAQRTSVNALL